MSEHTPLPWDYVASNEHHGPYITSSVGGTICDLYTMSHPSEPSAVNGGRSRPMPFYHEMADPNAQLIVRAVNAHDALVKALEFVSAQLRKRECSIRDCAALDESDAALALAKGEQP